MPSNTFGEIFKLTSFGESHGTALGGVVDGMLAGVKIDISAIQSLLARRRPGQSDITTSRKESDEVEILSGIFEGVSTGMPIGFIIRNKDAKSSDYDHLKNVFRASHADYTYQQKFGVRDYRGGGRSSARETVCRIVGGALAMQMLNAFYENKISVNAYVSSVGNIHLDKEYSLLDFSETEQNAVRCPDEVTAKQMIALIEKTKTDGDTIGGIVSCVIKNIPVGLGEPVFNKLNAALGSAMLGINAVHGFEFGSGFAGSGMKGSEHNDIFNSDFSTVTNHSGGIQGGISNGMDIYFRVAFKPVSSLMQEREAINQQGEKVMLPAAGRHDPCVVPRAVPVVEAMSALVLADFTLKNLSSKI